MTESMVLEPGRALDMVVAERVMGWTEVGHYRERVAVATEASSEIEFAVGVPPNGIVNTFGLKETIPAYSTDLGAALKVFERLGYDLLRGRDGDRRGLKMWCVGGHWGVELGYVGEGYWTRLCDDRLPYLICLAALKVLEEGADEAGG